MLIKNLGKKNSQIFDLKFTTSFIIFTSFLFFFFQLFLSNSYAASCIAKNNLGGYVSGGSTPALVKSGVYFNGS